MFIYALPNIDFPPHTNTLDISPGAAPIRIGAKCVVVLLIVLQSAISAIAQNLVPNPSFEYNTNCPSTAGQIHFAAPWVSGNIGTADYLHSCANFGVWQTPNSGVAYARVVILYSNVEIREYIQARLTTSLIAGQDYEVSFYVARSHTTPMAANNIGAYFSSSAPYAANWNRLAYTPQFNESSIITNDMTWTLIDGTFTAAGGEEYITIGNFLNNSLTSSYVIPGNPAPPYCMYLIDDVCVTPVGGDGCSATLPIDLLAFNAENVGERLRTFWSTASELNNAYFTVLRSKDAQHFSAIGTLPGAGNSYTQLDYEFYDEDPFSGISYYQLQQTDFNGSTSLSDIVSVDSGNAGNLVVWPNPALGLIQVELNGRNATTLEVINALGQKVLTKPRNQDKEAAQIDISKLPSGFYSLRLISSTGQGEQTKFIKK